MNIPVATITKVTAAILGVVAVVLVPLKFVAWAEDNFSTRDDALRTEIRSDAQHAIMQAAQALELWEFKYEVAEDNLIEIEKAEESGDSLTQTEQRKKRNLESNLDFYEEQISSEKSVLARGGK